MLLSTSAGKHPQDSRETEQGNAAPDINAPDVAEVHVEVASAQNTATTEAQAKTKQKVSQMVWTQAGAAMRALEGVTDNWERGANALSPTPPFTSSRSRLALAGCLVAPLVASYLLTPYMLVKSIGFTTGVLLFGDPILVRMQGTLMKHYPEFSAYLAPQNSVLRGVPTNAQLAITLLRVGEYNRAPIPPPLDSTKNGAGTSRSSPWFIADEVDKPQHKHAGGVLRFLKRLTGGSIHVFLSMDNVKAAAGIKHAQDRKGVVQTPEVHFAGPVRFPARYKGRQGYAYITLTATSPALSWASNPRTVHPEWTVSMADIMDIAKVGGLGWKSKMVVSWALEKQVVDGLIIKTVEGDEFHLTAVEMRDELFKRVVASGPQMWEAL